MLHETQPPAGSGISSCCAPWTGTGGRPRPQTGSQGSSAIWTKSQESSALAREQCRESCPAAAGSRAALTGTRRVGRGGQIHPHPHRPRKIQFLVQTWVCVTCEKHRIKPGSGRMTITVAVALLHKTLYLILESNNA